MAPTTRQARPARMLLLMTVLALAAVGCGGEPEPPVSARPLSIAVVAPSSQDDLAFSQSIVEGVAAMEGPVEVEVSDDLADVDEAAAAIRQHAADGVDLVIAHGSQYGGAVQDIAPDHPEVAFAWGTAVDTFGLDNVYAYDARADQGGYVNGIVAAALTSSGRIGVVGPVELGDAGLYVDGFLAGVSAAGPSVEVTTTFTGSYSDVELAASAAQELIDDGADVLTGSAQMVAGATRVAAQEDVRWFGTQWDQRPLGPNIVVASQVYRWEVVLDQIAADIRADQDDSQVFSLTLANGGLEIVFSEDFAIPEAARDAAQQAIDGLVDGTITTGV